MDMITIQNHLLLVNTRKRSSTPDSSWSKSKVCRSVHQEHRI